MDYWRAFHETQPNPKAFPVGREKFSYDHLFQRDWKTCITSKVLQDESDHSGRKNYVLAILCAESSKRRPKIL